MVTITTFELVVCFLCMIVLGVCFAVRIYWFSTLFGNYKKDKEFILDYIYKHKKGNDLPSKLIYKYLSREEKQNILMMRGEE